MLVKGDSLPIGESDTPARTYVRRTPEAADDMAILSFIPRIGLSLDLFAELTDLALRVDARSDRTGTRFSGSSLRTAAQALRPSADPPSRPMVRGAIQLPPDGVPIVLGPDGPTTGGYPVLGVLTRAACALLGRVPAGGHVRFVMDHD
jgi:allophanate hydrolase subunit 2